MRTGVLADLGVIALALQLLASCAAASPPTAVGAALSGQYRNLFAERGHADAAIRAKVDSAWQQLFHGDPDQQTLVYQAGENEHGELAYLMDVLHDDVRSEGMSYGMMIAVQLDHKAEFDALWNWAWTYMYQRDPSHPSYGYFAWSLRRDGTPISEMPAPDGEEYFATALVFAAARWGNGDGIYDYRAKADQILSDMRHRAVISGDVDGKEMAVGDMFSPRHAMVRFTPHLTNAEHTDASYHLPAFYEVWARLGPSADRDFWARAARVSRDYFETAAHPDTGLVSDYGNFDGSPWAAPWNPNATLFAYDAWRTAMNWSVDWSWWQADKRAQARSDRLQQFFAAQGMDDYVNIYTLDGQPRGSSHNAGLVATNAVASLAATGPQAGAFVDALWNLEVPSGADRYYGGMLYLMSLLHCAGEFRAWWPPAE